jgi:hypothetical protein
MKTFKPFLVLSVLLILLNAKTTFATHVVGGEVSFSTAGNRNYEVTLKLYRDCSAIQLCGNCQSGSSPVPCSQNVNVFGTALPSGVAHNLPPQTCSGTNYGSYSLPIAPGSMVFDAVQLCSLNKSICRNCNTRTPGTFTPGVEVYTFRGNINLTNLPASCCWVSIGTGSLCCRSTAVTTLQNPGALTFFIDAQINTCLTTNNSSPVFTNEAEPVMATGVDFYYSLGAFDYDGDSLSYRLGATQLDRGVNATYSAPYSPTVPFPYLGLPGQNLLPPLGINLDPISGLLRFRPMGTFTSYLPLEVLEWRKINGVSTLISITRRDIQFTSAILGGNSNIGLKVYENGIVTNNNSFNICSSDQKCFDVIADASPDTTDLEIILPSQFTAATITRPYNVNTRSINGPKFDTLRVCLNGSINNSNQIVPYFIPIVSKNRSCPKNYEMTRILRVNSIPSPRWLVYGGTFIEDMNAPSVGFPYNFTIWPLNQIPIVKDSIKWFMAQPGSNLYNPINSPADTSITITPIIEGWHKIRIEVYSSNCGWVIKIDSFFIRDINVVLQKAINSSCVGDSNGSLIFNRYGAFGPILATVSAGSWNPSMPNLRPWLPVDTISNLAPGFYNLQVKDSRNYLKYIRVEIKRSSNPFVLGAANITNVNCNGDSSGQVTLNITGGDSATFRWYSKDSLSWQNSSTFSNLRAGNIKFHIRDSVGCRTNQTLSITQPTALVSSASVSQLLKCKGDSNATIMVQANGGTSPYQTKLGQGNFASVFNYGNLKAGLYNIEVKDNKGCIKQHSVNIVEPSTKFTASPIVTQPLCNLQNGSATISAQGGVSPYQYWLSGNTPGSNNTISNIPSGNRTLFARDSAQCLITMNITLVNPTALNLLHNKTENTCFGDSVGIINLIPSGGKRPYQFNINGGAFGADSIFRKLAAGNYSLILRDSAGCEKTLQTNLIARQPILTAITTTPESCKGAKNGTATAVVSGGTAPYNTTWLVIPLVSGLNVSGLPNGWVKLRVIDNLQCVKFDSAMVNSQLPYDGEVLCGASYLVTKKHTQITWNKTPNKRIIGYKVYYQLGTSGTPVELSSLPFTASSTIVDSVSPNEQYILYSLKAIDSCGNSSNSSALVAAPLLEASRSGNSIVLNWNYQHAPLGLSGLQLYKSSNNGPFLPLYFANPSDNSFTDSIGGNTKSAYYLEAIYAPACANNFRIFSNRVQLFPNSLNQITTVNHAFLLYPNPAQNWVKVQSKSSQTFKAVRIYNLQGQLVLEQTFTKPVLETEISLPNLPKGVYQTIIDATETQRENIPLLLH